MKPIIAKTQKESYKGLPQRFCLKGGYAVYSANPLSPEMEKWCLQQVGCY